MNQLTNTLAGPQLSGLFTYMVASAPPDATVEDIWELTDKCVHTDNKILLSILVENPHLMDATFSTSAEVSDVGWAVWQAIREYFMDYYFEGDTWVNEIYGGM